MAADLQGIGAFAHMIGVMKGPAREPKDLLLELGENLQVGRIRARLFLRHDRAPAASMRTSLAWISRMVGVAFPVKIMHSAPQYWCNQPIYLPREIDLCRLH